MRHDLSISLLHLPIVGERIELVSLLRRPVLIGAVTGVVVFEERDRTILPWHSIRCVAHHTDAIAEPIQRRIISAIDRLQAELAGEIEDAARCSEMVGTGRSRVSRGLPNPTALLRMLVPIVL